MYKCNVNRMEDKIKTFSQFGDAGHGGITRYSLSKEAEMARDEFVKRMKAIGAEIETDDLANIYATIPGSDPNAKRIVMGSHCDSVKNGGNYDGILGVMGAMEVLETVVEQNIPHKHPLTAMIFTNEEGSEFPPCMMCSGILAHDYMPERFKDNFEYNKMMASRSILDPNVTFGEKLSQFKYKGDIKNRMSPDKYKALFELHIEQGPILEDAGKDPIKRAELIGNLVQSISIIPEAIVRDVYIKECSQLLRVEDKLLVSEVAKRRETQAEKQAEQRNRETRKNNAARDAAQAPLPDGVQPPYPEDMPPYPMDGEIPNGGAPLPPETAEYVSYIPQEGKEGQEFYKYERLILQMVVRYGEKVLCNVPDEEGKEIPITVTEYVVNDLKEDELAFHNPLHRQMLTEAAEHIHNEGFTAERYFLAHPNPKYRVDCRPLPTEQISFQSPKVSDRRGTPI